MGLSKAAVVTSPESGISMEVETDRPGVQLYAGNFLNEEPGKDGVKYGKDADSVLRPSISPNAPMNRRFESPS